MPVTAGKKDGKNSPETVANGVVWQAKLTVHKAAPAPCKKGNQRHDQHRQNKKLDAQGKIGSHVGNNGEKDSNGRCYQPGINLLKKLNCQQRLGKADDVKRQWRLLEKDRAECQSRRPLPAPASGK